MSNITDTSTEKPHKPTAKDFGLWSPTEKPIWWEMGDTADGWYWHDGKNVFGPFASEKDAQMNIKEIAELVALVVSGW